jgi:hypothetical protein
MGAPHPLPASLPWSRPRKGIGSGDGRKPPKNAKKPPAEPLGSAAPVSGRRLVQRRDIEEAIRWRLRGLDEDDIAAIAGRLRPLAADFTDSRREVAVVLAGLRRPGDRRAPWSLACAVLAEAAASRGDVDGFWSAGLEVLNARRQSLCGRHNHRNVRPADSLDRLIVKHLPVVGAATMFDLFAEWAGGVLATLADYDVGSGELVCQLDPDDETLTNVGRAEFARRVQRCEK